MAGRFAEQPQRNPFEVAEMHADRGWNTSKRDDKNCTVWYNGVSGEVYRVGPEAPRGRENLMSIQLKCDNHGVLAEPYNPATVRTAAIERVLDAAAQYRKTKPGLN